MDAAIKSVLKASERVSLEELSKIKQSDFPEKKLDMLSLTKVISLLQSINQSRARERRAARSTTSRRDGRASNSQEGHKGAFTNPKSQFHV